MKGTTEVISHPDKNLGTNSNPKRKMITLSQTTGTRLIHNPSFIE
ncbi:hypothetical protein SAMD00020551_0355 [Mesobacillus selenatarsenatis SF-1]|uniref:Uncharacterized protein n=1 Tax=Mesobacillus selenatarsenatis (strain DSM 18680 / JCM 14380 / FERM P-15431 / SF-1) TaxID=1321606 RepID=A0A0A8WZ03_MESS1|nr:hypothetical protein SAMD00020551_0355 [Mesobacillus selenatarsenatis SF-1]